MNCFLNDSGFSCSHCNVDCSSLPQFKIWFQTCDHLRVAKWPDSTQCVHSSGSQLCVNTIFIYFWGLSGLSVSQLWFSGPALWAMASQASESQRWSCGTLQDGFDVMDLAIQEQKILREIQAIINVSHLTMFKSKCMVPYILNYLPLLHPDRTWMMNLIWRAVSEGPKKVRIWGFQRTIKRI